VKEASVDELAAIEGFGPKAARAVWDFFHAGDAPREAEVAVAAEPAGVDESASAAAPSAEPGAGDAGALVTEAESDAALAEEAAGEAS
jgi:excinuclease ABC subunit C